jgi:hypothetical protein
VSILHEDHAIINQSLLDRLLAGTRLRRLNINASSHLLLDVAMTHLHCDEVVSRSN